MSESKNRKVWIATIQNKYKIHIPAALRTRFNVKEGDQVIFILEGECIYIKPIDKELSQKMMELITQKSKDIKCSAK